MHASPHGHTPFTDLERLLCSCHSGDYLTLLKPTCQDENHNHKDTAACVKCVCKCVCVCVCVASAHTHTHGMCVCVYACSVFFYCCFF